MKKLLQKVIDYYEGKGEYNYYKLTPYDKENARQDDWLKLYNEIKEELRKETTKE